MAESQPVRVQHRPCRVTRLPSSVHGVAGDGMAQRRQVQPDLVSPAGFQIALDECMAAAALDRLDPGASWSATLHDRHAQAIAWVAADGPLDHLLDREPTPHNCQVGAGQGAVCQLRCERSMSLVRASSQDQARSPFVQTVHDTRPGGAADGRPRTSEAEKCVSQGSGIMAGRRVDDHARRLVHDDQVRVVIYDRQRNSLRSRLNGLDLGELVLDQVAWASDLRRPYSPSIQQGTSATHQAGRGGTAEVRLQLG